MIYSHFNKKIFVVSLTLLITANFLAITAVYAASYVPLAPLPGTTVNVDGKEVVQNAGNYIKGAFNLAIGIAAALAIIMIIVGGIQYMGTESIGGKGAGLKKIKDAVLGLLLALGSYVILLTINPALVNFNVNIPAITSSDTSSTAVNTSTMKFFNFIHTVTENLLSYLNEVTTLTARIEDEIISDDELKSELTYRLDNIEDEINNLTALYENLLDKYTQNWELTINPENVDRILVQAEISKRVIERKINDNIEYINSKLGGG